MDKISENTIRLSFLNELEKQAGFGNLIGKVLRKANLEAGAKGIRSGLATIAEHKGPLFALPKGALKKTVNLKTYGKDVGKFEQFLTREMGDTAHALHSVTEGVGKGQSAIKNVGTLAKNFGSLLTNQVRAARYKIIPKETAVLTGPKVRSKGMKNVFKKPIQTEIQGKGLFKGKRFNRPIAGRTTSGGYIVKKRKGAVPLAMAITPVGFGGATFLLGSGKQNESLSTRTKEGLKETALWSLAPPVAQVKLISDILK